MPTPSEPIIDRTLDLPTPLARKSRFLLGPRQTGKTTLIRRALPRAPVCLAPNQVLR